MNYERSVTFTNWSDVLAYVERVDNEFALTGLAVFRRAYGELAAAGGVRARLMSALVGLTAWPLLRPLSDAAYRAFARHRLRISALAGKVLGDEPPVCEGDRCRTR